jgi:hypothetical protein
MDSGMTSEFWVEAMANMHSSKVNHSKIGSGTNLVSSPEVEIAAFCRIPVTGKWGETGELASYQAKLKEPARSGSWGV